VQLFKQSAKRSERIASMSNPKSLMKVVHPERAPAVTPLTIRFYGEEFIFDTVSGAFYGVSPTAGFIIRRLSEGMPIEQLAVEVEVRYHVDRIRATRDIEKVLEDLGSTGTSTKVIA
jgi:hypothetical protein